MCAPASYDDLLNPHDPLMEPQFPAADVSIVASSGHSFPANSSVLASASPVLEKMLSLPQKRGSSGRAIPILGVSDEVVLEFLRLLYGAASGGTPEEGDRHAPALLALAHAYSVGWLKRRCEAALCGRVGPEDAVDVMKLAKLCDAPRLSRRCLAVAAQDFGGVQRSEGWQFAQDYDPWLELEVLQFIQETEQRRKRWRRERADQEMFRQLGEAIGCLEHICTEGCTEVGPHDGQPPNRSRGPCTSFHTCRALQLLIRHFAACAKKRPGGNGCIHCRRMWQLFRLHSCLCDADDGGCKVPLCRQFKERTAKVDEKEKGEDATWRLLVRKVKVARVMSTMASRKMPEQLLKAWEACRTTG